MKVYVVMYGEYSDKYIDGIYLDKEKAETVCAIGNENHWDDYRIEEYETADDRISGSPEKVGRIFFEGELRYDYNSEGYLTTESSKWVKESKTLGTDNGCSGYVFVPEKDPKKALELARKIYADREAKRKALLEEFEMKRGDIYGYSG